MPCWLMHLRSCQSRVGELNETVTVYKFQTVYHSGPLPIFTIHSGHGGPLKKIRQARRGTGGGTGRLAHVEVLRGWRLLVKHYFVL